MLRFARILAVLLLALSLHVASISAQINPAVTNVVSYSISDTTIRVVISTGGHEHVVSTAVVEWLAPDSARPGERRIVARADVPIISSGLYVASDPSFDVDDKGLACIISVTNTHVGPYALDQRIRVRVGAPGKVADEFLDDLPLRAVRTIVPHLAPSRGPRDRMTKYNDLVVEHVPNPEGMESPWTSVRDTVRGSKQLLEALGSLEEAYTTPDADGSIQLEVNALECCGGTMSFYERYRIHPASDTAELLDRIAFMNELDKPLTLRKVARPITTSASMKMYLRADKRIDENTLLDEHEVRAWTAGVSLIPNTTAWIVATQEHWGQVLETWALVIGYPQLTPDVRRMFNSDNTDAPGMMAGWVKIGEQR